MNTIFSNTDQVEMIALEHETILQSSLRAGIKHTHVCGGHARCSTCRIHVLGGLENCQTKNEAEQSMQAMLDLPDNVRLACQTTVQGHISIRRLVIDDLDTRIIRNQLSSQNENSMGHEKDIAVVFVDLENYTPFAESLPAYDVVHILNRYYLTMNQIITEHHGVISDVAGDGMLVLFGVCKKQKESVLDAVNAVKAIHAALKDFNQHLRKMYQRSFSIRAGIHYGPAIVGQFNTGAMHKIAAIGDTVNLASRIEQANKQFGSRLLLSEAAYAQLQDAIPASSIYSAELKGKTGMHALYEIDISTL